MLHNGINRKQHTPKCGIRLAKCSCTVRVLLFFLLLFLLPHALLFPLLPLPLPLLLLALLLTLRITIKQSLLHTERGNRCSWYNRILANCFVSCTQDALRSQAVALSGIDTTETGAKVNWETECLRRKKPWIE